MRPGTSISAPQSYGFQRVHAALQTGYALTVQQQRQELPEMLFRVCN